MKINDSTGSEINNLLKKRTTNSISIIARVTFAYLDQTATYRAEGTRFLESARGSFRFSHSPDLLKGTDLKGIKF
jgi:hypothetical protein